MLNVYEELGETSRRQILAELRTGPKNVSDLCASTGLKQPNVSNHLARMRAKGIVKASKVGRQVWYTVASPEVEAIVSAVLNSAAQTAGDIDFETLSHTYAKHAVGGDETGCAAILDQAFRARSSLIDIYEGLLTPAMILVGEWWKVKAIDEAQEHLATGITERMMARAVQVTGPMRRAGKIALLGCAPGSYHTVGLRMIADYLRLCGWRVLYLGADVPEKAFLSTVRSHHPHVVMLSCSAEVSLNSTQETLRHLAQTNDGKPGFVLGVGGRLGEEYNDGFKEAGADFVAASLRDFAIRILPKLESLNGVLSSDRDIIKGD